MPIKRYPPILFILYTTPVGHPGKDAGTADGKHNSIAPIQLQKIRRKPEVTEVQETGTTTLKYAV
jgi:hypothetical protein